MTDSIVPDWIKQIKQKDDQEEESRKSSAKARAHADAVIQAKSLSFWTQLLKELEITAGALKLIDLAGSVVEIQSASSNSKELAVQVSVMRSDLYPAQDYVNMFYSPGGSGVRCHPLAGPEYALMFGVTDADNIVAIIPGRGAPLTAADAAKEIIEPMVKKLRRH